MIDGGVAIAAQLGNLDQPFAARCWNASLLVMSVRASLKYSPARTRQAPDFSMPCSPSRTGMCNREDGARATQAHRAARGAQRFGARDLPTFRARFALTQIATTLAFPLAFKAWENDSPWPARPPPRSPRFALRSRALSMTTGDANGYDHRNRTGCHRFSRP